MNNQTKFPVVKIIWRDAQMFAKQRTVEEALKKAAIDTVTTIGFQIGYEGKNPIVARDQMNNGLDIRAMIVIPVENIVSHEVIMAEGI